MDVDRKNERHEVNVSADKKNLPGIPVIELESNFRGAYFEAKGTPNLDKMGFLEAVLKSLA